MAQVEAPANLDRWPTPEGRLITIILIRCGLRATDACTLPFDCLLHDGQQAALPALLQQQDAPRGRRPDRRGTRTPRSAPSSSVWPRAGPSTTRTCSPPLIGNAGGRNPMTYYSYRGMLNTWLAACDVHDEHGRPVHLTPHQWRHTFACRLINRDVPQEVVRVLLDHESHADDSALRPDHRPNRPPPLGGTPPRSTSKVSASRSTPTGLWHKHNGPRPATASPPRPCPTATADCRCNGPARTPTPA